jgi:predicted ATPase
VTGEAGIGKSRLAHELVRAIQNRYAGLEVWMGSGDLLRPGLAFGLIGQALRHAARIAASDPIDTRRAKLRARAARRLPDGEEARVARFLGEICGIPFEPGEGDALGEAQQDATLLGEQTERAWLDFLRAETAAHPVLLLLDDLHWGDLQTVRLVNAALRELSKAPFMTLALARPEVHEIFARLWPDRGLTEIRLKALTTRASERLVRQVLGDPVEAPTLVRIVTTADGHPFYLEELLRAAAEGKGEETPPTVRAMVIARLEDLEGDARRVLRAASVFGEVFWQGGVTALVGGALKASWVESWLNTLTDREVLVRRPRSRFPDEHEYAFRDLLLRECTYTTLTDGDRTLGHRLAAMWLEAVGETDPTVLDEHHRRGGGV